MVSFSQPQGQLERKRSSNAGFNTTTHVDTKDKRGAKSGKILQADSGGGDLYINHFNAELKKLSSNILHLDARLAACSQLAHLLYHGAILEEYVLENQKVFDVFIAILGGSYEPFALRLQAIQTFSVLCRSSDGIQKILCDRKTVDLLIKLIIEGYEDMRKWACHCLLFLMVKNHEKHLKTIKKIAVKNAITRVAEEDWSHWTYNDAEQLLRFTE